MPTPSRDQAAGERDGRPAAPIRQSPARRATLGRTAQLLGLIGSLIIVSISAGPTTVSYGPVEGPRGHLSPAIGPSMTIEPLSAARPPQVLRTGRPGGRRTSDVPQFLTIGSAITRLGDVTGSVKCLPAIGAASRSACLASAARPQLPPPGSISQPADPVDVYEHLGDAQARSSHRYQAVAAGQDPRPRRVPGQQREGVVHAGGLLVLDLRGTCTPTSGPGPRVLRGPIPCVVRCRSKCTRCVAAFPARRCPAMECAMTLTQLTVRPGRPPRVGAGGGGAPNVSDPPCRGATPRSAEDLGDQLITRAQADDADAGQRDRWSASLQIVMLEPTRTRPSGPPRARPSSCASSPRRPSPSSWPGR